MILKDHFVTVFFNHKSILDFDPYKVFLNITSIDTLFRERFLFFLQKAFEASSWKKEGYLVILNDDGQEEEVDMKFWTVFLRWIKYQDNYVKFADIGPNKYFTRDIHVFFLEVKSRMYTNIRDIMHMIKKCKLSGGNELCNLRGGWYENIRDTMYRMIKRMSTGTIGGMDDCCNLRGGCFYEFKMCLWSLEGIYEDENETCAYFKELHRLLDEMNSSEQVIKLIDETLNSYSYYRFNVERKETKKIISD
ncbi:24413_t:CDS:1 [Cetraspora pellucida]|uniref:24413_t:CDS:1 n=1 Tax=Cetraspora pellucida TaxID=1433469 RepID=A0A9N9BCT5_9GLOM|nr:24413_t:CDS:1 [Cetraspora pellucida]